MGWLYRVTYTHCGHAASFSYVRCWQCPPNKPPAYCPIWQVVPFELPGVCQVGCPGLNAPYLSSSRFAFDRGGPSKLNPPSPREDVYFNPLGQIVQNPAMQPGQHPSLQDFTVICGEFTTNVCQDPNGDVTIVSHRESPRNAVQQAAANPAQVIPAEKDIPQFSSGSQSRHPNSQLDPKGPCFEARSKPTAEPEQEVVSHQSHHDACILPSTIYKTKKRPTAGFETPSKIEVVRDHSQAQVGVETFSHRDSQLDSDRKSRSPVKRLVSKTSCAKDPLVLGNIEESIEEEDIDYRR